MIQTQNTTNYFGYIVVQIILHFSARQQNRDKKSFH